MLWARCLHVCVSVNVTHSQRALAGLTDAQRLREGLILNVSASLVTVVVDSVSEGVPVAAKWVVRERHNASVCPVRGGRRHLARICVCVEPKEARRAGFGASVAQCKCCAQHVTSATGQCVMNERRV